jgi:MoaA/NifB/PqqE/SkfB family radical SAM enzyme
MVKTVYLHLTSQCNSNCRYCYIESKLNEMNVQEWKTIIDKLAKNPPLKISITGGEPLLYPGAFEIANYCKQKMPKCIIRLMTTLYLDCENSLRL